MITARPGASRRGDIVRAAAALLVLAAPAVAQQQPAPTQAELVEALTLKAALLTQNIDQLLIALGRQKAAAEEADAQAKWVLDHWVPK